MTSCNNQALNTGEEPIVFRACSPYILRVRTPLTRNQEDTLPSYDLTGTVKLVMDQQSFDSGFTKREFVVTTDDDRYPQEIKFECVKDKVSLLDNVLAGSRVTVTFDMRGNEYNERYYVNLTAWKIEQTSGTGPSSSGAGGGLPVDGPPLDQMEPPGDDILDDGSMPF